MSEELRTAAPVLQEAVVGEGLATGEAFAMDEETTAITVEKDIEASQPTMNTAAFKPGDTASLVYMYNKVLAASKAPAPGASPNKSTKLNAQENDKVAHISNGAPLNPAAPNLKAGSIKEMLLLFSMLDKRGMLQQVPNIRKSDLATYNRLTGKGSSVARRMMLGPMAGRRRNRIGMYAGLSESLRPAPKGKRLETVFVGKERSKMIDANAGLKPAPVALDARLAPTMARRGRAPKANAYKQLLLWMALSRPEETPAPTPRTPMQRYGQRPMGPAATM